MYDRDGWIFNECAILNKQNIEFNDDDTLDAFFGDCGEGAKNNLPVVDGWNFLMRVYEPRLDEMTAYSLPTPTKVE